MFSQDKLFVNVTTPVPGFGVIWGWTFFCFVFILRGGIALVILLKGGWGGKHSLKCKYRQSCRWKSVCW